MQAILMTLLAALFAVGTARAEEVKAEVLVYAVDEQGAEPYRTRILVTPDHLRMDEGEDGEGYTLFDRRSGTILNVDNTERSVLIIDPPAIELPPLAVPLELVEEQAEDPGLDAIGGNKPRHYRLLAGGERCEEVIAVTGVMSGANEALSDFYARLANQHALVMMAFPEDFTDPCDLAENIYAPRRRYAFGLPLHQWSARMKRDLESYQEALPMNAAMFSVPTGYREFRMPEPQAPAGTAPD